MEVLGAEWGWREEELQRGYQCLAVLDELFQCALSGLSLDALLERFMEFITSISWLALESKAGIFLADDVPGSLVLRAHRGLPKSLLSKCARIPFGRCLCGRAASLGEVVFADCIDGRHDHQYEGISPHGHYCVPIMSHGKNTRGVLMLTLREGRQRNKQEETFLRTVAGALAAAIELKVAWHALAESKKQLEREREKLEEADIALRVLIRKRDEDRKKLEENVLYNVKERVVPYLEGLKNSKVNEKQNFYIGILESNLAEIISPFSRKLSLEYKDLTPAEHQVANLVKFGKSNKEIADLLNLSVRTIESHRENIRKKLGISRTKVNLRSHLLSFL